MLSMTGKMGVAILANAVILTLNVSPGSASSTKIGTRYPASNVDFRPWDLLNDDLGISALGTWLNWCVITDLFLLLRCAMIFYLVVLAPGKAWGQVDLC